jgi:chromosome segregation protein
MNERGAGEEAAPSPARPEEEAQNPGGPAARRPTLPRWMGRTGTRSRRRSTRSCASAWATMGAVNLVAIEEYAELKQRHDFLQGQSDDLVSAKAN